jgi:hypothetical protein
MAARFPNPHGTATTAGVEADIADLKSRIDAQKSPESRLQAAMSCHAAAQKDLRGTEAEVSRLAAALQEASQLEVAQRAKVDTLHAEVAELKLLLPSVAPPPEVGVDALLAQLAQHGVPISAEALSACMLAARPPEPSGPRASVQEPPDQEMALAAAAEDPASETSAPAAAAKAAPACWGTKRVSESAVLPAAALSAPSVRNVLLQTKDPV